jgi:hypothetical protein
MYVLFGTERTCSSAFRRWASHDRMEFNRPSWATPSRSNCWEGRGATALRGPKDAVRRRWWGAHDDNRERHVLTSRCPNS